MKITLEDVTRADKWTHTIVVIQKDHMVFEINCYDKATLEIMKEIKKRCDAWEEK